MIYTRLSQTPLHDPPPHTTTFLGRVYPSRFWCDMRAVGYTEFKRNGPREVRSILTQMSLDRKLL